MSGASSGETAGAALGSGCGARFPPAAAAAAAQASPRRSHAARSCPEVAAPAEGERGPRVPAVVGTPLALRAAAACWESIGLGLPGFLFSRQLRLSASRLGKVSHVGSLPLTDGSPWLFFLPLS